MKTRNITLKRSHLVTGIVVTAAVVLSSLSLGTNLTVAISEDTSEPTISAQAQVAYQTKQQEKLELSKAASQKQAAKFVAAKAAKAANNNANEQAATGTTSNTAATQTASTNNATNGNPTTGSQTAATSTYPHVHQQCLVTTSNGYQRFESVWSTFCDWRFLHSDCQQ